VAASPLVIVIALTLTFIILAAVVGFVVLAATDRI
jgi:hypothetical protein